MAVSHGHFGVDSLHALHLHSLSGFWACLLRICLQVNLFLAVLLLGWMLVHYSFIRCQLVRLFPGAAEGSEERGFVMESGHGRLITLADAQPVDTAKRSPSVSMHDGGLAASQATHFDVYEASAARVRTSQHVAPDSPQALRERARKPLRSNAFERATKVHCLNLRSLVTALPEPIAIRRGGALAASRGSSTQAMARPLSALSTASSSSSRGLPSRGSRNTPPLARPASAMSTRSLKSTKQLSGTGSNRGLGAANQRGGDDLRPSVVKISPYLTRTDKGLVREQLVHDRLGILFDMLAGCDGYMRGVDYARAKVLLKLDPEGERGPVGGAEGGGWMDWDGFLLGVKGLVGGNVGKLGGGVVAEAIQQLGTNLHTSGARPNGRVPTPKHSPDRAPQHKRLSTGGTRRRPASARAASRGVSGDLVRKTGEWLDGLDMDPTSGGMPLVARIPFSQANRVPTQGTRVAPHRRPASAPPAGRKKHGEAASEHGAAASQKEREREGSEAPEDVSQASVGSSPESPSGNDGASRQSRVLSPIKSPTSPSKASRSKSKSPQRKGAGVTPPTLFSGEGIPMWPGRWPEKERKEEEREALLASGAHDREAFLSLFMNGRKDIAQGGGEDDEGARESRAQQVREARKGLDERWEAQLCSIFNNDFWKDPTKNRVRVKQRVVNHHPLSDFDRHLLDISMQELMERTVLDKRGDVERDEAMVSKLGAEKLAAIEDGARQREEAECASERGLRASAEAAVVDLGEERAGWLGRELNELGILYAQSQDGETADTQGGASAQDSIQ